MTRLQSTIMGFLIMLPAMAATSRPSTADAPDTKSEPQPAAQPERTAREVFALAAPAVVKLYGASVGRQQGYGSGVLVSPDGLVLTNLSVMLTGRSVRVVLHDGTSHEAELLRRDDARKLALLRFKASGLPYLTPHPSDALQTGDAVYALGNWFKIAEGDESVSLTRGVFSFKATIDARRLAQEYDYPGPVLIYDAITANPGAAGGPLLDARGRLVGLVGLIVESAATNTRVNHAIPGEDLISFLKQDPARPTPSDATSAASTDADPSSTAKRPSTAEPYIGLTLSKVGYRQTWAFVERVRRDGPADRAGIRPDDLIIAIDGRRVADGADYQTQVAALVPGQRVPFTLKRGTEIVTAEVTIATKPGETQP
jgi:S1-C subfamily serine protease